MSHKHVVRIIPGETVSYCWMSQAHHEDQSAWEIKAGEFHELEQDLQGQVITLLIPAQKVAFFTAKLPQVSTKKRLTTIPYLLEEELAEEINQCHFAILAQEDTGELAVAVLGQQILETYLAPFAAASIPVECCLPDALLLPWQPGQITLCYTAEFGLVKPADNQVIVVPLAALATLLKTLTQEFDGVIMCHAPQEWEHQTRQEWQEIIEHLGFACEWGESVADMNHFLVQQLRETPCTGNLLQGAFQPKKDLSALKPLWLTAAGTFAASVLVFISTSVYHYHQLNRALDHSEEAILQLYQRVFPGSQSVNSPKILVQRELEKLEANAGRDVFFRLLSKIGHIMPEYQVALHNTTYHQGQLIINLRVPNFSALEGFSSKLEQQGLTVQRDTAFSQEDHIQARLTIGKLT